MIQGKLQGKLIDKLVCREMDDKTGQMRNRLEGVVIELTAPWNGNERGKRVRILLNDDPGYENLVVEVLS